MTSELHTIFGAGQVGRQLASLLLDAGHRVRMVRRGPAGPARANLTWMRGDASDRVFADKACVGAHVVYNCANPTKYHKWHGVIEPLFNAIRDAAGRAGARLVVLDNLYMYGAPDAAPFNEQTPMNPCSNKGALRAALATDLMAAHERGDVQVACGRASDYFGPGATNVAIFGDRFFERLAAGKPVELMGNPELARSYSYLPDVARGLMILGTRPETTGRVWHLPVAHQGTTLDLVAQLAAQLGVAPSHKVVPRWLLRTLGVAIPLLSAVAEMVYQWERPFVVDDAQFCATFGVAPTDIEVAVRDTAAALSHTNW